MKSILVKSKKLLLLVLTLCVLITCKSDIVFASDNEENTQTTELVYNLKTTSYNIGNDTDGDGIVDDFGDTSTSSVCNYI